MDDKEKELININDSVTDESIISSLCVALIILSKNTIYYQSTLNLIKKCYPELNTLVIQDDKQYYKYPDDYLQ